jgi:small subunit ribosomal protein S1
MGSNNSTGQNSDEINDSREGKAPGEGEEENFSSLFEKSLASLETGGIVTGKVMAILSDMVAVDIKYKTEGFFPVAEAKDEKGNVTLMEGDEVLVLVERIDSRSGMVILSKEKADKTKLWDDLQKGYEEGTFVKGVIMSKVKGGFEVDIGSKAFLPGSQADTRQVKNPDSLIGIEDKFKILKFSRQKMNIVVSRRAYLEEVLRNRREELIGTLKEGDIIEGRVKNITDYGVFIDLGGLDGLMHITDISFGKISHPSEVVKVGDEIKVKVIRFDKEKRRVSLGLKQLRPDPWSLVKEKYGEGDKLYGVVTNITKYGAFIEIEEGVEGLLHISEMSWSKNLKSPGDILSIGDRVEVVALKIDEKMRKISLGLKQLSPNPWDIIKEKFPEGSIVDGKVKNLTDFGIFVELGEEIDGLVHISDLSWNQRIKHPAEMYRKGDKLKVRVLKINQDNQKFSLGIKQLKEDPWLNIQERYKKGGLVTGRVTSIADFGAFIELEEGIEGLVHITEISEEKPGSPSDVLKIGDVVTALITGADPHKRKISLSIKLYQKRLEKKELEAYINKDDDNISVLGEALKEQLKLKEDNNSLKEDNN